MSHLHGSETWPKNWPAYNETIGRYEYGLRKADDPDIWDNSKSAGTCEILAMRHWVPDSTLQLVQHLMYNTRSGKYDEAWQHKMSAEDAGQIGEAFGIGYDHTSVEWRYVNFFFVEEGDWVFRKRYTPLELESTKPLAKDGKLVRLMIARMGRTRDPGKEVWELHARETMSYLDKAIEFRKVDMRNHQGSMTLEQVQQDPKYQRHMHMREFLKLAKQRINSLVRMLTSDSGTPQKTSEVEDEFKFIQFQGFKLPTFASPAPTNSHARKRNASTVIKNVRGQDYNGYSPQEQLNYGIKRLKERFKSEDDKNWLLKQEEDVQKELEQQRERRKNERIKKEQDKLAGKIQENVLKLIEVQRQLKEFKGHAAGSGVNYNQHELDTNYAPLTHCTHDMVCPRFVYAPQFTSIPNMFSGPLENTQHHELIMHCVNFYTAMHIGDVVGLQCNYNALRKIGDQLPVGSFHNGALWQHIETEIDAQVQRLDTFSYGTLFATPQYLIALACIWKEDYLVDTCWLNQCLYNHEKNSLSGMPTFSQSPYVEMEPWHINAGS